MSRVAHLFFLGSVLFCLVLIGASPVGVNAAEPAYAAEPDAAPAAPQQTATVLMGGEAGSILGKEVRSVTDEKLGRIVDVIVDRSGTTRAAIIDFGGFLGVGSKKIAVAWDSLIFSGPENQRITVLTTRERLSRAPEFREGRPIIVLGASELVPRITATAGEQ
jgi:hypothetical protein